MFQVGKVTPKKRRSTQRTPMEKRKDRYKKGTSPRENRKRRSTLNQDLGERKKKSVVRSLRANRAKNATFIDHGKRYTGSAKEQLIAFYKDRKPSKLDGVPAIMAKYAGNEEQLFLNLAKRYNVNPAVFQISASATASRGESDEKYTGAANESGEMRRSDSIPVVFGVGGAFAGKSSQGTFGSLASPKSNSGLFGNGSRRTSSKGRTSITSLMTYTEKLRLSSDSESIDSESDTECD